MITQTKIGVIMKIKNRGKFRFKNMFSMIMRSYVIILCIPVIMSVLLFTYVQHETASKYRERIKSNLHYSSSQLEKKLDLIEGTSIKISNDYHMNEILRLGRLLPASNDVNQTIDFQNYLKSVMPAELEKYTLFLKNDYVFTSSSMTYGNAFFIQNAKNYKDMQYKEWQKSSLFSEKKQIMPNRDDQPDAVVYSVPMNSLRYPDGSVGSFQYCFGADDIRELFAPIIELPDCAIRIYNANAGSKEPVITISDSKKTLRQLAGAGAVEKDYDTMQQTIGNSPFRVVAVMPDELIANKTEDIRVMIGLVLLVSLLIEVGLGVLCAYRYSLPIRNLLQNISNILKPGTPSSPAIRPKNDYEKLEYGVNKIIRQNSEMENVLHEKEAAEQRDVFLKIFTGSYASDDEISKHLAIHKITLTGTTYCAVLFDTRLSCDTLSDVIASEMLIPYGVQTIAEHLHAALIAYDTTVIADPKNELAGTADKLAGLSSDPIWIGAGRSCTHLMDLAFSFRQASHCVKAAKKNGASGPVFYEDIASNLNTMYYPSDLEEHLSNSVHAGNSAQIKQIFASLYNENAVKRDLTAAMVDVFKANLTSTLIKIYDDMVLDTPIEQILERAYTLHAIDDVLHTMEEIFLQACNKSSQTRQVKENKDKVKFTAYIDENYSDPQASIKAAAEEFSLSESYFSIMFKEAMGENFSTCLERARIDKAKELILSDTNIEVVSRTVGYNSSGTFRRAFKRITGLSPAAWKESQ